MDAAQPARERAAISIAFSALFRAPNYPVSVLAGLVVLEAT